MEKYLNEKNNPICFKFYWILEFFGFFLNMELGNRIWISFGFCLFGICFLYRLLIHFSEIWFSVLKLSSLMIVQNNGKDYSACWLPAWLIFSRSISTVNVQHWCHDKSDLTNQTANFEEQQLSLCRQQSVLENHCTCRKSYYRFTKILIKSRFITV
jgi:hypothetical protein